MLKTIVFFTSSTIVFFTAHEPFTCQKSKFHSEVTLGH